MPGGPALGSAYWRLHHALKGLGPRLEALETHRTLPPAEARRDLALRLQAQLRHFASRPGAFPEWKALGGATPEEVFAAWSTLPILTKSDLRERFPVAEVLTWTAGPRRVNATGGSTGEPTRFVHDLEMLRAGTATMYYGWRRMGWRPGMPVRAIWGAQRDIGLHLGWRERLKQRVLETLGGIVVNDGFALDPERGRAFLAQILASPAPCAVYGYTSLLEAVARQAQEEGIEVPRGRVATAWNGGETLFAEQSARFAKVFGVPIQNDYGGREVGTMAIQARGEEALQVLRPFIHLEVVDEAGRPCPPGQPGRILVTSTVCRATPFLRYEIGDVGAYGETEADESGLRGLRELHGRISSTLQLNGKTVSSIYWNHLFKDYPEVRAFQVRGRRGALRILLEGPGLPPEALQRIRETVVAFLGPLPLDLVTVDRIPVSATGKLIHVLEEPEEAHA